MQSNKPYHTVNGISESTVKIFSQPTDDSIIIKFSSSSGAPQLSKNNYLIFCWLNFILCFDFNFALFLQLRFVGEAKKVYSFGKWSNHGAMPLIRTNHSVGFPTIIF